ncbi:MAG: ATP-binding cassette domain-containing protein [Actinobacteria bacterium]|nr:MAG: ATP-binding cassette domain-containing protein [Actinomycetota bacterium]
MSYDGGALFRGVSFTLSGRDQVGLVGPHGVGMSTLLRVLAGELKPQRGAVTVRGTLGYYPQQVPDPSATIDAFLADFPGALLVVAHDRAFLNRVVGAVIELDGIHGEPRFHAGNYTAYRIEKEHRWQRLLLGFEAPEKARIRLVADIEWTRAQAGPVERTVRRGLGACGTPGRWPARPGRARDGYAGRCCPPGGWPHRRPSRYWHWRSRRR